MGNDSCVPPPPVLITIAPPYTLPTLIQTDPGQWSYNYGSGLVEWNSIDYPSAHYAYPVGTFCTDFFGYEFKQFGQVKAFADRMPPDVPFPE